MAVVSLAIDRGKIVGRLFFLMTLFYLIQVYTSNPGLCSLPLALYLKENLGFSAVQLASFQTVAFLPWLIKPLWGTISDNFTLFGYHIKSYLLICYTLVIALFLLLAKIESYPIYLLMFAAVLISTCIAFSDVLADKLMVIEGKAREKIAVLQAAQWAALGFGGAMMYYLSGWIAQNANLSLAFLLTAIAPFVGLVATWLLLSETKVESGTVSIGTNLGTLWSAAKSPHFLAVVVLIACLQFHPDPPIFYYQRDILNFEKYFLGISRALVSLSIGIGAIVLGFFAPQLSRRNLFHIAFCFRLIPTLCLLLMHDEQSAILVGIFNGFISVMATISALTIAARACPTGAEGTAYALLISLWNLTTRAGIMLGGWLWDNGMGFSAIVIISAICTTFGWLLIPLLKLDRE